MDFHFLSIAEQSYTEQIANLADQTGWKVYVYPDVLREGFD